MSCFSACSVDGFCRSYDLSYLLCFSEIYEGFFYFLHLVIKFVQKFIFLVAN